tara:strand:- start:561 stop:1904 length:1344 start_codon:yes stop_codon:yes gene_type:complete
MKKFLISFIILLSTSVVIANTPADSVGSQGVAKGSTKGPMEKNYFEFLRKLHGEQPKESSNLLGRLSGSSNDLEEYKISEYNTYLKIYFPNHHSDHVQRFMIESYIDQGKWNEVEVALLKFVYLYPNSELRNTVIENGFILLEEEDYYQSNKNKLLTMLQEAPNSGEIQDRYFKFLSGIHALRDPKLKRLFKREAWEYLRLYSNVPRASKALMGLAGVEVSNNAHHSALMIYEKLMTMHPESHEFSTALFQAGKLKQEQFNEENEAVENFRQFLMQFPEHRFVSEAQYRIATISDQNFNDWTTAIGEYEKVVTHYPINVFTIPSLLRIGEIQAIKLRREEDAIATYNRIASEYPDSTVNVIIALQRAGKLYEKSKEYEEAIAQYMAVYEKYPGTEGALVTLEKCAVIYEKKIKRKDKAVEKLNIIVKEYPGTKKAKKAAKRIKKLNK